MSLSHDPYFEQEAKKYQNPIASREYLLQIIRHTRIPMNRSEIETYLNLTDEEQKEALRRRLRAMEKDGQLIFTKRKRYALPDKLDLIKGKVIGHRDGYGFLRVEGSSQQDWFIPHHQMQLVMHDDIVLAQPTGTDRKGRTEVRIVRLLESRNPFIVGRYFIEEGVGYVIPDDRRINQEFIIPKEDALLARMGQVVVVQLKPRTLSKSMPVGKIVEVLGDNLAKGMEVDIAIRKHDIPYVWSESILSEIKHFQESVPKEDKKGRLDLRNMPLVTIDGEDARDFDDAVYCEKTTQGWILWVAIADVSYYVRPKTSLDNEAKQRGNSVYFPNRVIPMLPEILSNGLCSLNPQVDRLCLVCEMYINLDGQLKHYQFHEAVMNSHARLTYNKVWKMLQGDESLRQRYQSLYPHLDELYHLFKARLKQRQRQGSIDFDTIETQFIFNEQGRIENIVPVERNDAHKIIEECMILANIAAAHFMQHHHSPALYRIHERPSAEKLTGLRTFLKEVGLTLSGKDKPKASDYAHLMEQIKQRPDKELLQTLLLRSLSQAVYAAENVGHFGLALKEYAHFTSPIRRYPDLTLHRGIKYLLAQQQKASRSFNTTGGMIYTEHEIAVLGEHCSMTERRADDATREVVDWLKCEYMQNHVGEEFDGVISTVVGFGFFVRLNTLFVDGLVHISSLANEYYIFDSLKQRLVGEYTGTTYRIGDSVRIKVIAVSLEEKTIDFELISTTRQPQRLGKTQRDKLKQDLRSLNKKSTKKTQSKTIGKKDRKRNKKVRSKKRKNK